LHLTCTSDSGKGNYEGDARIAGVTTTYHGCDMGAKACASEGAEAGEIVSEPLEGEYVRLQHQTGRAGLDLFPTSGRDGQFRVLHQSATIGRWLPVIPASASYATQR
jgi:hypothetical protein